MAEINLDIDDGAARAAIERWPDLARDGGEDAVDQLTVLAEGAMKDEAPEGAGIPRVHMRTTIKTWQTNNNPYTKVVAPTKRTSDGWPLHHAIIEGTDAGSYTTGPPPLDPILQWVSAKIPTPQPREVAQRIRWSIFHDGHETLPNEFIDRSLKTWTSQVEDVASRAVENAFDTGP